MLFLTARVGEFQGVSSNLDIAGFPAVSETLAAQRYEQRRVSGSTCCMDC